MRRWGSMLVGAAALVWAAGAGAAPKPARDARVWAAAQAARAEQLKLLETLVNIDSGTGDVAGGRKIAAILTPRLAALGMAVEAVPAEAPDLPENLVATLSGTGKGRILLIAHMDTVFEPGAAARRPFSLEGGRARGPGVADEKGGVVEGLYALTLLKTLGFKDFGKITFLIETSEERGSTGTRKLIDRLVREHDVELNLEPGDPPDVITVWRKGSVRFRIDVKGRAAHAGVAPQDGRNAAVELLHQLQGIEAFPRSGSGLTVNLTMMQAGARENIIPENASATMSVRVREPADFARVEAQLRKNAETTVVPDTTVSISRTGGYPPLPTNPATEALADRAAAIYAGLGLRLERGGNGGASESALAHEAGTPALDGLGPVGGGTHSETEYLELSTLTPRLYLLTKLIMELGRDPPTQRR